MEEKPYVLKLEADFSGGGDTCSFYYKDRSFWSRWTRIGPQHKMRFSMEHFCGCRFGLTVYSTREAGGSATFSEFVYRER